MTQHYYRIEQHYDDYFKIKTPLNLPDTPEGFTTNVISGWRVSVPTPPLFEFTVNCAESQRPKHLITGECNLVISGELLAALRKIGVDNFETWPVVLREPNTSREWKDYFLFNEIGLLDAVLMSESQGDTLMEGNNEGIPPVIGFHEIVFDAKKTRNRKMFRIPQMPTDLYISDVVKAYLDTLHTPEEWGITFTDFPVH
jgi:hypothetical protein